VKIYNEIIRTGKVTRGSIGVQFTPSESNNAKDLLRAYGANEGVFIQQVAPGGPAEKAGLAAGDIITAISGKPVHNGGELVDRVTASPIGTPLDITVLRSGKQQTFKVVVADLAQVFSDRFGSGKNAEPGHSEEGTQAKFGITIENLNPERRDRLGLKEAAGVLISQVEPGSFAEDIGLTRGDVLTEINRQAITSVDDVKRIQNMLKPGQAVAFRVMRSTGRGGDWTSVFLAGTLPNPQQ
jgi:serine protease Do